MKEHHFTCSDETDRQLRDEVALDKIASRSASISSFVEEAVIAHIKRRRRARKATPAPPNSKLIEYKASFTSKADPPVPDLGSRKVGKNDFVERYAEAYRANPMAIKFLYIDEDNGPIEFRFGP